MQTRDSEYALRLNRVLDYIHAHLDQPLTLEVLAAVAGFSPFHFHRLFKGMAGETLNDYVQRARLEKAANLLLAPQEQILTIALACGFSSAAVFARTFRAHFGMTPSEFRKNRKVDRKQGKEMLDQGSYNTPRTVDFDRIERRNEPMHVEIKTLPAYHVAYIRSMSGYSKGVFNSALNQAFQRVCGWAAARDLFQPDTLVIGIPYDNPDITPNDRCRYDACVTIPTSVTAGTGEIDVQQIPGGKYAVCRIEVPGDAISIIGQTVDRLYGEWLPTSAFAADDKPALEIYYGDHGKPPGTWIKMDFCLPVKPL